MQSQAASPAEPERQPRKCPSCGSALEHTGAGGDELLECSRCGLVMFDAMRHP